MSKYKTPDGTICDDIKDALAVCCEGTKCDDCPLWPIAWEEKEFCFVWADKNQKEAAKLLGFEVIKEKKEQEPPKKKTMFKCPGWPVRDTVEQAVVDFCTLSYCDACPIYGETRGPGSHPNVVNAKVCGEWAAKNLDRALELTGIEVVEAETAEMIPPENIKEARLDEREAAVGTPNVRRHWDICKELNRLYERKNHDYGDSFHQSFEEEGMAMARIRLGDKLNRFKTLSRQEIPFEDERKVKDESIRDTLIDLANYAIMTVMEMEDDNNG